MIPEIAKFLKTVPHANKEVWNGNGRSNGGGGVSHAGSDVESYRRIAAEIS